MLDDYQLLALVVALAGVVALFLAGLVARAIRWARRARERALRERAIRILDLDRERRP